MLVYEIFRSLGLKVSFRPAVTELHYYSENGDARPVVGLKLDWVDWDFTPDDWIEDEYDKWTGKLPKDYTRPWRWSWNSNQQPEPEPKPIPVPEYVRFEDVHWLNDLGHKEPQISWVAVSGQSPPLQSEGNQESTDNSYLESLVREFTRRHDDLLVLCHDRRGPSARNKKSVQSEGRQAIADSMVRRSNPSFRLDST